jgi:hypothetical protein
VELSPAEYKALARLESNNSPDWQCLKQALRQAIEAERDALEQSSSTETLYRLQGRAGALRELLHAIVHSREIANQHL